MRGAVSREGYSEEFAVKVGVHQGSVLSPLLFIIVLEALGSVLSPLLFIIVLEALSREVRCGFPREDLYADELLIIAESLKECVRRLLTWKEAMEKKRLRVNAGKTKIMICGTGLALLQRSGEFPCAVCRTGVGSNSIFCNGCKYWAHKKCSGFKRLTKDPDYRCTRCQGTARRLDGRPQRKVQVGPDKLEVVASFCYLGDMLSAAGGCKLSTTTRVKTAWKKFKELLPVISSRHLSFKTVAECTALVCRAQCSMPVRLGHWQNQTSNVCSGVTGQWSDRSAMSGRKALSPPGPMNYLRGLALRIWTSFWRREGFAGMDMWNAPVVQSRQPFTYRLRESVGLGGPRRHGSNWQRGIAESGSSRLSTLMIEICGDLVWDLPCVQQASCLEGVRLMWMLPRYLHVNKKSDYNIYMRSQIIYMHSFVKSGFSIIFSPQFCKSDMSGYGYLEVFQRVPWTSR